MTPLDDKLAKTLLKYLVERRSNPRCLAIELIMRTGMRTAELIKINLNSVNQKKGMIFTNAAKGSRDHWTPVDKGCLIALEYHLREGSMPWQRQDLSAGSVERLLRRYWYTIRLDALGYMPKVGLHSLRATFAVTIYKNAGRDIKLVQELLGHKAISSTDKYVRLVQVEERKDDILKAFKRRGSL